MIQVQQRVSSQLVCEFEGLPAATTQLAITDGQPANNNSNTVDFSLLCVLLCK